MQHPHRPSRPDPHSRGRGELRKDPSQPSASIPPYGSPYWDDSDAYADEGYESKDYESEEHYSEDYVPGQMTGQPVQSQSTSGQPATGQPAAEQYSGQYEAVQYGQEGYFLDDYPAEYLQGSARVPHEHRGGKSAHPNPAVPPQAQPNSVSGRPSLPLRDYQHPEHRNRAVQTGYGQRSAQRPIAQSTRRTQAQRTARSMPSARGNPQPRPHPPSPDYLGYDEDFAPDVKAQPYQPRYADYRFWVLGGVLLVGLTVLIEPTRVISSIVKTQEYNCQEVVQPRSVLSREQLVQLLTIPERSTKDKVRAVMEEPYCLMPSVTIRAGIPTVREAYPLEFDPDMWIVMLYEGDEYAGYRFNAR